jgi:hypothetical protein
VASYSSALGPGRRGLRRVGLDEALVRREEIGTSRAERVGPRDEDPLDLAALVLGETHELVVQLDRLERLDEAGRSGRRGRVDDPAERARRVRAHGHDEAAVALRDELVADHGAGRRIADEGLEVAPEARGDARALLAQSSQLRARLVGEPPVRLDPGEHRPALASEVGHPRAERVEARPAGSLEAPQIAPEARCRVGDDGEVAQPFGFETGAFEREKGEGGPRVRGPADETARGGEVPPELLDRLLPPADLGAIDDRAKCHDPVASGRRPAARRDAGKHRGELERVGRRAVQVEGRFVHRLGLPRGGRCRPRRPARSTGSIDAPTSALHIASRGAMAE